MVTTVQDAYDTCLKDAAALLPATTPYLTEVNACKARDSEVAYDQVDFDQKNFVSEFVTVEPVETEVVDFYKLKESVGTETLEPGTEIEIEY